MASRPPVGCRIAAVVVPVLALAYVAQDLGPALAMVLVVAAPAAVYCVTLSAWQRQRRS